MEQLFGAIPAVVGGLEKHVKLDEAIIFAAWYRCAGEMLSDRTVALGFEKKRLVIAVADVTWQRHLEDLAPQMIAKINGSLGSGTVRFIEFQIDEKAVQNARKNRMSKSDGESHAVSPELVKAAMSIADEGLRKNFLEAAGDYLARQETKKIEI